jgi:hypothetical protein
MNLESGEFAQLDRRRAEKVVKGGDVKDHIAGRMASAHPDRRAGKAQ